MSEYVYVRVTDAAWECVFEGVSGSVRNQVEEKILEVERNIRYSNRVFFRVKTLE